MTGESEFQSIDLQAVWAGSQQLHVLANRGLPRIEFLGMASRLIMQLLKCDAVYVRLSDDDLDYEWEMALDAMGEPRFHVLRDNPGIQTHSDSRYPSIIELPLTIDESQAGKLVLKFKSCIGPVSRAHDLFENVARTFGLAVANRRAQARLRERIKELTCLYKISGLAREPGGALHETLDAIVRVLPSAWQYPEIAGARILIGQQRHVEGDRSAAQHVQAAPIMTGSRQSGIVEVFYTADRAEFAEGTFLPEEQSLIEGAAREIGRLLERIEAGDDRKKLEEQVRRADRLATIGQLAAGVAHELNEPLGSILGFAQLIEKTEGLGEQVGLDLRKIIDAALQGRQIIKNLLLFARQAPAIRKPLDVNALALECQTLFSARCAKREIALGLQLADSPALIQADASQLKQVLVNLALNAIQAMPAGGALTLRTSIDEMSGRVVLSVIDTGIGMGEEIRRRIFDPFFTTKDVGEGTGLGLSVVHGIVAAHDGDIHVESEPGRGSTFSITFPRCRDLTAGGE